MEYTVTLYDKTGKIKLGELADILAGSHYVVEERNGIFELSFDYPNGYPFADKLINENMVEVKPSDEQGPQKFRIYDTQCLMEGIITVLARHESYDLINDHVENINLENASCEYALNTLFRNSHFSKHYRGYSDIINAQNYVIDNVNVLNAIAGKQGSIIDTYGTGAEILRDGTNIHVLNKRGHDNDVTIEFGKNLTGFVLERDLTDLETRVGGFAKYTDANDKEVIVKSNWIDSPYINNFAHPYIGVEGRRDYSDKFKDDEIPTVEKLNKLCSDEFKINKRDIPRSNYTIEFIPLSKCVGYEDINDKISLCDTVRIIDKRFGVDTKAKVIKCKYDFIKQRYESMELGEPRTTLGDVIGGEAGPAGPQGPAGKDGADGNIGDFPNSLPSTPMLSYTVKGFASIDLSWTFEDKVYYTYELYASKYKDFEPNVFDIIHKGQTSSFLFQSKPGETWYFRVCAKNTHGNRTEFSPQVTVETRKSDDFEEYFSTLGVGNLVTSIFSADYMEAGIMKGHWIDARNLSVTDGNGKRTLDIDSFGNIYGDFSSITLNGEDIRTTQVSTFNMVRNPTAALNLNNWGAFLSANCEIKRVSINLSSVKEMPTRVHFIDIGDGLCVLIESNGKYALIDTGNLGTAINKGSIQYIKNLGVKEIDYFIITHHHNDHNGECERFLDNFNVKNVYTREPDWSKMPATEVQWQTKVYFDRFYNKLKSQGKDFIMPTERQTLWMSNECALEIFNTGFNNYAEYNDLSFGVLVRVGSRRLFIAGDISYNAEAALKGKVGHVDYLCGGHHAYNTSNSDAWLNELNPTVCIFTSENIKGSSQSTVVNRVKSHGIEVYSTNLDGTIVITMDSKSISHNAIHAV